MYCQHCGHQVNSGDKFCPKCGKQLVSAHSGKWKPLIIAAAVVISVCAAVWAGIEVLGNEKSGETKPAKVSSAAQSTVHHTEDQWMQNILMPSEVNLSIPLGGYRSSAGEASVFGTQLSRKNISSVIFEDSVEHAPEDHWDVSLAQNNSVLAWVLPDGSAKYELHIAAEGGINGKVACKDLFFGYSNLEKVIFNGCFHTEQTEDFSRMFYGCMWALETLDLREIRTDNAVTLSEMFASCSALTMLDLSNFDTSHVKDMSGMFSNCSNLQRVDIEGWNTSNVTNVSYMFYRCPAAENCDFTKLNFENVKKSGSFVEDTVKINGKPWKTLFSAGAETKNGEFAVQTVQESWKTGNVELTLLSKDHIRIELEHTCFMEEAFKSGDKRLFIGLFHNEEEWNCYDIVVYNENNALKCHCSYLFAGSAANDYHPQGLTWSVSGSKVTIDLYTGDRIPWSTTDLEKMTIYLYDSQTREYEDKHSFWLEF